MTEDQLVLTRRRILGGLLTVSGAGAAAGAGTMAAFSDTEPSTGNNLQTGTLNLTLDGSDQSVTFFDDATAIKPTDSGSDSVDLLNTGSVDGTLDVIVDDIRNYENSTGHKESQYDDGDTGEGAGELQDYFWIQPAIDGTPLTDNYVRITDLSPTPFQYSTGMTVSTNPTNPTTFTIHWEFREGNNSDPKQINETQTDSVEVDLTFRLVQGGG